MKNYIKPMTFCKGTKPVKIHKSKVVHTKHDLSNLNIGDKVGDLTVGTTKDFKKVLIYINPLQNY